MSYIVSPTAIFCSFALSVCYALQPQELTSETSMAWTHRNPVTLHDLSHAAEQRTRLGYHLQGVVLDIREILALGEMNVKGLIHVHTCMEMRHFQNATTVRTRRSKMAQFLLQNIFFFQKPKKDMESVSPHSTIVLVAQKVKLRLSGFCAQHRLWGQSSSASSWRLVSHLPCSAIACCKVSSSCLAPVKINAICRSVDYVAAASPPSFLQVAVLTAHYLTFTILKFGLCAEAGKHGKKRARFNIIRMSQNWFDEKKIKFTVIEISRQ